MQPSIYHMRLGDILTICVLALLLLGVVMVQSAGMTVTDIQGNISWHWSARGLRHTVFTVLAAITFFLVGRLDYHKLIQGSTRSTPTLWILLAAVAACLVVLVPGIGIEVKGARRWLPLGITQLQPSELGKWATVLFLAWCFARGPIDTSRLGGFVLTMLPVGLICLAVVIEDLGTAALIALCALTLCLAGGARLWHLGLIVPPALAAGIWFIIQPGKEYRWRRLTAFLDPFASPRGEGYHMIQSLLSFCSGGILGRGLGRGVQKLGYLPEDTTDFIFAVISEELGLFGAVLTIFLYLGILYVVWQVVRNWRDTYGRLLAFGIGAMIGLQVLINVAVATVSIPPKGLSLPLVSAGGSGLILTCAALGLLYSICRHEQSGMSPEESTLRA